MKFVLCVTLFILLAVRPIQLQGTMKQVNLFPKLLIDDYSNKTTTEDSSSPSEWFALVTTGVSTKIPIQVLAGDGMPSELIDSNISSPYVLHMKFKIATVAPTFLFSIEEGSSVKAMVQITTVSSQLKTITLLLQDSKIVTFDVAMATNTWANIMLYVKDDKIIFYSDCEKLDEKNVSGEKVITLSRNAFLTLGKTQLSGLREFEGSIAELTLHTNASDDFRKSINCPNTDYDEDPPTDEIAENLERMPTTPEITRGDMGNSAFTLPQEPEEATRSPTTVTPAPILKGEKGNVGIKGETGLKGEKGEKGAIGPKGEQGESLRGDLGPVGPPGKEGPKGKQGDQGTCECSESVVKTLLQTMPEMKGPRGDPGPPGVNGSRGMTGISGQPGTNGELGPKGTRGEKGDKGADGKAGIGERGPEGIRGHDGAPGPVGPKGEPGIAGPPGISYVETEDDRKLRLTPGEKGAQGPPGSPGSSGLKGDKGEKGERGERGLTGDKGVQGLKGAEGPIGPKGHTGASGRDGIPGTPGSNGINGLRGERGDVGQKGATGATGLSASIQELLDENMEPSIKQQIVEKLRGEKGEHGKPGDKGSKGAQGIAGNVGEPGQDGLNGTRGRDGLKGAKGDVGPVGLKGGKGDTGAPGPAGIVPASEIALMKGDKGVDGAKGQKGDMGQKGNTGKVGPAGKNGAKGDKGDLGQMGPAGPMGPSGYNGTIGVKGDKGQCIMPTDLSVFKGERGIRGEQGLPGKPGVAGLPGKCEECNQILSEGPAGPQGPPGPPGPPGLAGPKGERGDSRPADDDVYETKTVTFRNINVLMAKTSTTSLGTLAYVIEENILLIRVSLGWQRLQMEPLIIPREPPHTQRPPRDIKHIDDTHVIYMAALNQPYSGAVRLKDKKGLTAADHMCHRSKNNFRAFLTSRTADVKNLVRSSDRKLKVVNMQRELLFDSWDSMFNGSEAEMQADILSFSHRNIMIDKNWPSKFVWHGSNTEGKRIINYNNYCDEWQSDSPNVQGLASDLTSGRLLSQQLFNCDNKFVVLCVQISATNNESRLNSHTERSPRRHYRSRRRMNNVMHQDIKAPI